MWRRRPSTAVGNTISGLRFSIVQIEKKNTRNPFSCTTTIRFLRGNESVYSVSYQRFYVEEEDTLCISILLSISNPLAYNI